MELSELKNISKLVDKKLHRAAKKEKQLKEQEQKELEEKDLEDYQQFNADEYADESENDSTSVTQKALFVVGALALVVGVVKTFNIGAAHE